MNDEWTCVQLTHVICKYPNPQSGGDVKTAPCMKHKGVYKEAGRSGE